MLVATSAMFSVYAALSIYDPGKTFTGPRIRTRHIDQGFYWEPGEVIFQLLQDIGDHFVEVCIDDDARIDPDAVRAILVPFTVPATGKIAVSDCVQVQELTLTPGDYALLFELGYANNSNPDDRDDAAFWVRFTLIPRADAHAAILRADAGLSPTYPLLLGPGQ